MCTPSLSFRSTLLTTCLAVTTTACDGGSSYTDLVEELPPLTATAAPTWDEPQTGVASPSGDPEFVEIHLDISSPMAGYIPPGGDGDLSVFQFVAQNAAQHMARVFGSAEAPVRWVGVGHELRSLGARPQIERRIFDGRSTQLDRSMERILGDFRTGRAEAAALVSDLMATGDVTGPLTLFGSLSEWLASADVRSGTFHVGLFGLKADYWGVRVPECGARAPLGCRFDELRRRWIALENIRQIPVYVLVLGRDAQRVISVMESLQATVDELNRRRDTPIETQWELLTRTALGRDTTIACRAGTRADGEPEPQYALVGDEQGQYCCVRDDTVTLFCDVHGGFLPTTARATWGMTSATESVVAAPAAGTEPANGDDADAATAAPAPPPDAEARIDGTRLAFDFACPAVRCGLPAASGLELLIEATGTVSDAGAVDWRGDWSTETGEIGRTLQLQGFVDAVRIDPDRYELRTQTLLHFPGRR